MKRLIFLIIFLAFSLSSRAAEIISNSADSIDMTIYHGQFGTFDTYYPGSEAAGLALINEIRHVDLPKGKVKLTFIGVAQTIVPQSARIDVKDIQIKELNFDYSLISPGDILANSIGEKVSVERTHPKTGKVETIDALLVSGPEGVLLKTEDGIEALDCGGEHKKIIFDQVPDSLSAKAKLTVILNVEKPGRIKIRLSYLATGFDWAANYVAKENSDRSSMKLLGWLTLVNQQNTSFENVSVSVIAGDISRDESTTSVDAGVTTQVNSCWYERNSRFRKLAKKLGVNVNSENGNSDVEEVIVTGIKASIAQQEELGDYKLYRLPFRTDLNSNQIKQIKFLDQPTVAFEKIYEYEFDGEESDSERNDGLPELASAWVDPTVSLIRFQNKNSWGLGKPLPKGLYTVFGSVADSLSKPFVGEYFVQDSPINLPVDLRIGMSDLVDVQYLSNRFVSRNADDDKYLSIYKISNRSGKSVVVELQPDSEFYQYRLAEKKLIAESSGHFMKDGVPVWRIKLGANEQKELKLVWKDND